MDIKQVNNLLNKCAKTSVLSLVVFTQKLSLVLGLVKDKPVVWGGLICISNASGFIYKFKEANSHGLY